MLEPFGARAVPGGPLADQPGVLWVEVEGEIEDGAIRQRVERLGYVERVERVALGEPGRGSARGRTWRKRPFYLEEIWTDSKEAHRAAAPDRRAFLLPDAGGEVRAVTGYRGSGGRGERRALPVADARLLVNLARADLDRVLLDPFAGAGGIVFESTRLGARVFSVDVDPILRPGLEAFGAEHTVGDARALPFPDASVHGVATEPPFDAESDAVLAEAIREIARVLVPGGRAALMIAERQRIVVERAGEAAALEIELAHDVDRKGTRAAVVVLRRRREGLGPAGGRGESCGA